MRAIEVVEDVATEDDVEGPAERKRPGLQIQAPEGAHPPDRLAHLELVVANRIEIALQIVFRRMLEMRPAVDGGFGLVMTGALMSVPRMETQLAACAGPRASAASIASV